jgi:endonuclease VIII
MPEGNTIHRLARRHTRDLADRVVRVRSPQGRFAAEARRLDRRRFLGAEAHGKHLFHRWEGGLVVHIHLGMAGEFYRFRRPAPAPRPSVRMRLSADAVTIDLIGPPTCELITEAERLGVLDRLGPDPLRDDADPGRVWQELRRRSRPIGDALLDQRVISGVGNIFRNEALFLAGIHPLKRSNRLTPEQWGALWETTSRLMRKGLKEGRISTVDPAERPHECAARPVRDAFYVYQREVCRRCGGALREFPLSGRRMWACRSCQPWRGGTGTRLAARW